MAVTIQKKVVKKKTKAKIKKKVVEQSTDVLSALEYVRSVADKAGGLKETIDTKKQELKVIQKQYDDLVKPIQSMVDEEYNPATAVHGSGKKYTITIGAKGSKSTIFNPLRAYELFQELGGEKMLTKVMSFSVVDIKNYLTSSEQEEVVAVEQVGARTLKITKV